MVFLHTTAPIRMSLLRIVAHVARTSRVFFQDGKANPAWVHFVVAFSSGFSVVRDYIIAVNKGTLLF